MICELCGKPGNEGFRIKLEGSVVSACPICASLGERVSQIRPAPKPKPKAPAASAPKPESVSEAKGKLEFDLVDDFGAKVKAAREKRGWTQDDLGKMVNETHSLIHRIELGKFEPAEGLAHLLESRLGVRLLATHQEEDEPSSKGVSKEVTLGDLVVMRRRNK
ncbi:MAG: multiprotein bridging factor aMBF1 [Candidatus Altiarchaeota archaeon]